MNGYHLKGRGGDEEMAAQRQGVRKGAVQLGAGLQPKERQVGEEAWKGFEDE